MVRNIKPYDQLEFTDDFMFSHVLYENPDLCRELIERILERKIREIRAVDRERSLDPILDGKGIRLDVYAEEPGESVFDLEMQVWDDKDLAKRSRYYHGAMDMDFLNRGEPYGKLPESYVIFICKNGMGEEYPNPVYHYVMQAEHASLGNVVSKDGENETKQTKNTGQNGQDMIQGKKEGVKFLNHRPYLFDGTHTIFLNAAGNLELCNKSLRDFLTYVRNGGIPAADGSSDDLTWRLDESVQKLKKRQKLRSEYMKWELEMKECFLDGRNEGLKEGLKEGVKEGRSEAAALFLKLEEAGRSGEFARAMTDDAFYNQLAEEFGLHPVSV